MQVLITGATSGIGLEAVRRLSEQGHQLTIFCQLRQGQLSGKTPPFALKTNLRKYLTDNSCE